MSLQLKGLRTSIYKVSDMAKAKEWYSAILGIAPYFDEPFYVGYNVAGYELGLQPEDSVVTEKTTCTITYWGVDDVQTAYDNMLQAGAVPLDEPGDVGGGIVVAAVTDPWGNAFGVIYNPHFALPA